MYALHMLMAAVALATLVAAAYSETVHRYEQNCETGEVTQIPVSAGDELPLTTFSTLHMGKIKLVRSPRLFARKRVLLFSVAAAYEPGADVQFKDMVRQVYHNYDDLGLDAIVMVMASDPFANNAFTRHHHEAPHPEVWTTVSDANGVFARGAGLVCPHFEEGAKSGLHLFAAVVNNNVIEWITVDHGHQHVNSRPEMVVDYLRSHPRPAL
ncbi:uncharacterized protein AMSG_02834 [Thecamonas trahens ATCC 50062]|uniref:Redoxin domain-containing protein n=1 Tax=Thecamonas trahens ATCC 50062 TaxID=461836 RepID=A0A0L0D273_THETB|nr:hypothetical protein AMSG_02834 [Thecamonas trahens ATCC 50062]KNC46382.1 hypothetical protein AMSG_02834 [Thecamonas trahens ATCC 50062]|eukprot:XP_013760675.1 hypothetical protein AMSG_02834 [Thecamonas trahens ATCC 50062]